MHLIAPLTSGFVGAENGFARIYRRGTSTRATVYTDFEASTADSSGDDIDLDSSGAVVIYVNELVQVQVYSSIGQLLRDFISGDGAYAVEVISPAFTGTDYTSGAHAVSKPTTAGAIFDLWIASAGAIDWKVLFGGVATDLQDALGATGGLFFNVKSPEFGAVGDDVTDDVAAWQAAHDAAADAGGGIVVAPPGNYLIGAELVWEPGVHLFCLPDTVVLRQTTPAASNIRVVASSIANLRGVPTYFIGCAFDSTQANSATQFSVGHASSEAIVIDSCVFGYSSFATGAGVVVGASTGTTTIRNSTFTARASTRLVYDTTSANDASRVHIDNCSFTSYAGAYGTDMVKSNENELRVTRSRFLFRSTSGDTVAIAVANDDYALIVSGCNFKTSTSGDVAYAVQMYAAARVFVDESNYFGPGVNPYLQAASTDITSEGLSTLALRAESTGTTTGVTATVADFVESYFLRSTNVAAPGVTLPKIFFYGQVLRLAIENNSGSNWGATSPTLIAAAGTVVAYDNVAPNLNNGRFGTVTLVAMNVAGSITWVQMGPWGNVA